MLDVLSIAIVILFFIRGYMKGIIVAVFSVLAILLGIMVSLKLSGMLGTWLLQHGWVTNGWGPTISYAILFIGVLLLVRLLAKAVEATLQLAMLGWINGIIGGLLYAFMGAVLWSSLLWVANEMHWIPQDARTTSKTYVYFENLAPWTFGQAGKILPFAKDLFEELNKKIP